MECISRVITLIIISVIGFVENNTISYAQGTTNYEFLSEITDSLLEKPIASYLNKPGLILLNSSNQHKDNWFIESRLFKKLSGEDFKIYNKKDSLKNVNISKQAIFKIDYKIIDLGITYVENTEIQYEPAMQRIGAVSIYINIQNYKTGQVIYSDSVKSSKSDLIEHDKVAKLENKNIRFTIGDVQKKTKPSKLINPIIISAVAGTIVYLFYSLRSR